MDLSVIGAKLELAALDPFLRAKDIEQKCNAALKLGLNGISVLPTYVKYAHDLLKFSPCKVICVVGYPLGGNTTRVKITEALTAGKDGASELEIVLNHSALMDGDEYFLGNEIYAIGNQTKLPLRVMIEASMLDESQIELCCKLARDNGAEMLCANTAAGLGKKLNAAQIAVIKNFCGKRLFLKIYNGIENAKECEELFNVGVKLIGSEKTVEIMHEFYTRG